MIYKSQDEVPEGWSRKKPEEYRAPQPPSYDKADLVQQLQDLDVIIDPRWGVAQLKKVLDDRSTSR